MAGLSKWRWWLMGIIVVAVMAGGGWAVSSARDMATVQAEHGSTKRDVQRHEKEIDVIENAQHANREAIIREVKRIPATMKKTNDEPPNILEISHDIEGLPLKQHEVRQIRMLLGRAKDRQGR